MTKRYEVSNDEYSGRVVIVCKAETKMMDTYKPTRDEALASIMLDRKIPEQIEKVTVYSVGAYYNYDTTKDCIYFDFTTDRNQANEFFKMAKAITR